MVGSRGAPDVVARAFNQDLICQSIDVNRID